MTIRNGFRSGSRSRGPVRHHLGPVRGQCLSESDLGRGAPSSVYGFDATGEAEVEETRRLIEGLAANAGGFWGGLATAEQMESSSYVTDYWFGVAAASKAGGTWKFARPTQVTGIGLAGDIGLGAKSRSGIGERAGRLLVYSSEGRACVPPRGRIFEAVRTRSRRPQTGMCATISDPGTDKV